ncbi:hypothetical protein [Ensifer sp. 1H6]|uniref:hypothetical protein n=1 Tax=Ensifer sp. 1H6 TaxID=1911585 RepID=UPI001301449B|nr:hypothetical protein [Ensifer sp. 1H6]
MKATLRRGLHEPEYRNWPSRRCCDHHLGGDVPNARDERHRDRNGNSAGNHYGTVNSAVYNYSVHHDSIHYGADYDRTINNSVHYRAIDNDAVDGAIDYPTLNHPAVDDNTGAITKAAARSCKQESGRSIAVLPEEARRPNWVAQSGYVLVYFPLH